MREEVNKLHQAPHPYCDRSFRSGAESDSHTITKYSTILSVPPLVVSRPHNFKITSLPEVQPLSLPVSFTPMISGFLTSQASPAITSDASAPPTPTATISKSTSVWSVRVSSNHQSTWERIMLKYDLVNDSRTWFPKSNSVTRRGMKPRSRILLCFSFIAICMSRSARRLL